VMAGAITSQVYSATGQQAADHLIGTRMTTWST